MEPKWETAKHESGRTWYVYRIHRTTPTGHKTYKPEFLRSEAGRGRIKWFRSEAKAIAAAAGLNGEKS